MKVGIVGAGISGIAAARTFASAGCDVAVFEKSRGFGGRAATRRFAGCTFDSGATGIVPRRTRLAEDLPTEGLVRIEKPVWLLEGGAIVAGDPDKAGEARYTYREGISSFAKQLAAGLDVRLETKVERVEGTRIDGERFDAVILSAPWPQSQALLGLEPDDTLYRRCDSVLLAYDQPTPEVPYHALLDFEGAVQWISLEHVKCPGRVPDGGSAIVAQLSATASGGDAPEKIAVNRITELYGLAEPRELQVMRWRYAQPLRLAERPLLPKGVFLTGDAFAGGKIEIAYEEGIRVAEAVLSGA